MKQIDNNQKIYSIRMYIFYNKRRTLGILNMFVYLYVHM